MESGIQGSSAIGQPCLGTIQHRRTYYFNGGAKFPKGGIWGCRISYGYLARGRNIS